MVSLATSKKLKLSIRPRGFKLGSFPTRLVSHGFDQQACVF